MRKSYKHFKRVFDIFFALSAIVLLFPIFIIIYIVVYFNLGKPVFFTQVRPGYKGNPFSIIKFRTMVDGDDGVDSDCVRMTKLGKFLRATSLDEIPEFINILKGDMSVVGPRPLLMEYLPLYSKEQARRHDVKPGLTGLAQISGRNEISWDSKLDTDIEYVDKVSFLLDMKIILKTILVVLSSAGVNKSGFATTTKFKGEQ